MNLLTGASKPRHALELRSRSASLFKVSSSCEHMVMYVVDRWWYRICSYVNILYYLSD